MSESISKLFSTLNWSILVVWKLRLGVKLNCNCRYEVTLSDDQRKFFLYILQLKDALLAHDNAGE
jgi:hypothetical protein